MQVAFVLEYGHTSPPLKKPFAFPAVTVFNGGRYIAANIAAPRHR